METFEIVRSLRLISEVKHAITPPILLMDRAIADAQVLIDPERVTPYPSSSGNTVAFLGAEKPITQGDASSLIDVYSNHGVKRFFVYLSPSLWLQQNIEALCTADLTLFRGPDYHTLVRNLSDPITEAAPCKFRIERVTGGFPYLAELEPSVASAVGRSECDVRAALAGEIIAGYGVATTVDNVTYLGPAGTSEPYRNRGAQTALIRARLHDAVRRGSQVAVSETLSMLESSLRNLQRAGFTIAYDKIVYQYSAN